MLVNDSSFLKILSYLDDTLGLEAKLSPLAGADALPYNLRSSYEVQELRLLNRDFLVCLAREAGQTPASIEKQMEWLERQTGRRAVYAAESLASYNRKRLIERKIPFIVPGNQLYVPDLGLDLREHIRKAKEEVKKLAPASQALVLGVILRRFEPLNTFTATGLAGRLCYSKMTMSRAIDELKTLKLVEVSGIGIHAGHRFAKTGRELWEQARPYLRSPVKKRIYLDEWSQGLDFQAGESALAKKTMIGRPQRTIWAVTSDQWNPLQSSAAIHIIPEISKDSAHVEFELWHYDPALLADKPIVDSLSLALSLSDATDERLQMAVDELLRGVSW